MTQFMITVTGNQAACVSQAGILTAGMTGAAVTVTFDQAWNGLQRMAVFRCGTTVVDAPMTGTRAAIPPKALLPERELWLGLYGTDGKTTVIPTVWVSLGLVEAAADPSGDTDTDPTIPIWAQLQAQIEAQKLPEDVLRSAPQTLSETQQAQARANIGAAGLDAALTDYDSTVKTVAHRGYSDAAPENTLPAYILARERGYRYVECDVAFTLDNVAVLLHDETVDRTSDGAGSIAAMTYNQAAQYDYGSWKSSRYAGTTLPTFEEFILLCKKLGLHPYIELKVGTQAQIESVVSCVQRHGMGDKVTYISFINAYMDYVKAADPTARLGYLTGDVTASTVAYVESLRTGTNSVFIDASIAYVTEENAALCQQALIPLEVWTVNTEEEVLAMHPYISGVTSDILMAGKVLLSDAMVYTPQVPPRDYLIESWDFTQSEVSSLGSKLNHLGDGSTQRTSAGLVLSKTDDVVLGTTEQLNSACTFRNVIVEMDIGDCAVTKDAYHKRLLSALIYTKEPYQWAYNGTGFIWRNTGAWSVYGYGAGGDLAWGEASQITDINAFANSTVRFDFDASGGGDVYCDGTLIYSFERAFLDDPDTKRAFIALGSEAAYILHGAVIKAVRILAKEE